MTKQYLIKVYSPTKSFLGLWRNASFSPFTHEVNGGFGECVFTLNQPFDETDALMQENNIVEVEVWDDDVIDEGTPSKVIYAGYVSLIEFVLSENEDNVMVHCLGHYTKLSLDVYTTNGTNNTSITETTNFVGAMFYNCLLQYGLNNPAEPIRAILNETMFVSDAPQCTYLFEQKTYREAIDAIASLASSGHFWFQDAVGKIWFKAPAATPKHTFILGRHFRSVNVQRGFEKVRTRLLFWNGETGASKVYKLFTNDIGRAKYGTRLQKLQDYGINDTTAAGVLADRFFLDVSKPEIKVSCVIFDNEFAKAPKNRADPDDRDIMGYDIESISAGDTCRFNGFDETTLNVFYDNMLITKVTYLQDRVELELQVLKSGLVDWQQRTANVLAQVQSEGVPTAYTT